MRPLVLVISALAMTVSPARGQDPGRDSIIHLLHRATWGARPGDVDQVARIGITTWIDRQLRPEAIADRTTDRFLARYRVLSQSPEELVRLFTEAQRAARTRQAGGDTGTMMRRQRRRDAPTGIQRATLELQQATATRAILSERQLYEVMVDVWTNHFNVFMAKNLDRALTADYIASAIRPHALGRFEDLLIATARHPAMLVYLDNVQSVADGAQPPQVIQRGRGRRAMMQRQEPRRRQGPQGINENYARELLELHTLGVDGGYTQDDIIGVARVLTGWSLDPRSRARFQFHRWAHDQGEKQIMGQVLPAGGGENEGVALLRWLANHPSTMRHVSGKLCARFVADVPPDGCIDAGVHAWKRTDGDIAAVVRAILLSPEFWAPVHRESKFKTPFEFVTSAARALGAAPDTSFGLARLLTRLGQPLFMYSAPTGYPERSDSWVSSTALFNRFNIALAIASRRAPGLALRADASLDLAAVENNLLQGRVSASTHATLVRETTGLRPADARILMVGLALGSPEFQRQ